MSKNQHRIHWLAVAGATFGYFALGGLWYSPLLFGPAWQAVTGPSELHQHPSVAMFVVPLISAFAATTATAVLVRLLEIVTIPRGAALGTALACGFLVPAVATDAAAPNHPQPVAYVLIVGGYHVVALTLVAAGLARVQGRR